MNMVKQALNCCFCRLRKARRAAGLACYLLAVYAPTSFSDELEIVPLSFGRFVIGDNNSVSTLTIRHDGRRQSSTNKMYPLETGTAGEYFLSNLPPFTPLIINVTGQDLSTNGFGERLLISNITHNQVTTDSNGEGTLFVGATLSTSGNGTPYVSAVFDSIISIDISF
ncbi:hypothetical protein [Halioxenophilus aromaticivorans]|uniref:DUF4402 domain-containing protein n=1 Tax=Halioxenophilus aromaticivorans TaxID=1306992 RepID=A0AAV3U172_9ALTE